MVKISRILVLFGVVIISLPAISQEFTRRGLIKTQLTLSPSHILDIDESHFYFHGNLEYFVSEKISFSGEVYYYLGNLNNTEKLFDYNHSLFVGPSWHLTPDRNDLYIGLQPGISARKNRSDETDMTSSEIDFNPLISVVSGYNYYLNNYFNFFVQSRLIMGEYRNDFSKSVIEIRVSAGLGFQLHSKKQY